MNENQVDRGGTFCWSAELTCSMYARASLWWWRTQSPSQWPQPSQHPLPLLWHIWGAVRAAWTECCSLVTFSFKAVSYLHIMTQIIINSSICNSAPCAVLSLLSLMVKYFSQGEISFSFPSSERNCVPERIAHCLPLKKTAISWHIFVGAGEHSG